MLKDKVAAKRKDVFETRKLDENRANCVGDTPWKNKLRPC